MAQPTLAQLRAEVWWGREIVPANLLHLVRSVCDHFQLPRSRGGTVGNEKHLRGRHRSIEWSLNSKFCTRRSYGTKSQRDLRGNHRHIRAMDVTWILDMSNAAQVAKAKAEFVPLCRRLDAAVRAGRLPSVAEWWGTFDLEHVAGWFEGEENNSAGRDHLKHLHIGLWTEHADGDHSDLFAVLTGEDDMDANEVWAVKIASPGGGLNEPAGEWLKQARLASRAASTDAAAAREAAEKALAIVSELQQRQAINEATLEQVLRRVLGRIDGPAPSG